jgi:hypothetical protein
MSRAKPRNLVLEELERFLDRSELEGVDAVRAALARRLAEDLDSVPPYALPRLAAALGRLLELLDEPAAEDASKVARRLVRQVVRP